QAERQPVLVAEALVRRHRVGADPQDHGPQRLPLLVLVAETARLGGAAGGVVLGAEVEHHRPAAAVRQPDGVALVVGGGEVRRLSAGPEHGHPPRLCWSSGGCWHSNPCPSGFPVFHARGPVPACEPGHAGASRGRAGPAASAEAAAPPVLSSAAGPDETVTGSFGPAP